MTSLRRRKKGKKQGEREIYVVDCVDENDD